MKELFYFYSNEKNKKNPFLLIGLYLILIYLLLLIKTAWIGDDAYITFRTIDNFVNGFGLRWNIAERVQSYTHPLWLLLLSAFYFFTREIFLTTLFISIAICVVTVYLLSFKVTNSYQSTILVLLPVIFSKAFIDYSTSGLENPLTNFLIVFWGFVYFKKENNSKKTFLLTLFSALILINRMDSYLLIFPAFIYYLIISKNYKNYFAIFLGFLPFFLWECFSVLYYGFPFPNTAYAKLNTGIARSELIAEGFKYFIESFFVDPITILIIIFSIILAFHKQNKSFLPFSIGIMIYLFYLIWIGGDFMVGRFFVSPFIISLLILARVNILDFNRVYIYYLIIILIGSIGLYHTLFKVRLDTVKFSIMDERLLYYSSSNLLAAIKGKEMPSHYWATLGKYNKKDSVNLEIAYSTGFFGFYSGNQCFIIDKLALNNPLLSRLPSETPWRIGHFIRKIPEGYIETVTTGINKIKNLKLAKYYDKISLITRGRLISLNRFKTIWKINTGQFDYLIECFPNPNQGER